MKRFLSVLFIAVLILCSVPLSPVKAADFGESLETIENATMSAVYETIRKLGYKFVEIPFGDDSAFTEVMKPIVDQMVDYGLDPVSLFRRLGNQLYYNISDVVQWVKSIFGSGNDGTFSPLPSGVSYDFATYNARVAQVDSSFSSYGPSYSYPLIIEENPTAYPYMWGGNAVALTGQYYIIPLSYDTATGSKFFFNHISGSITYEIYRGNYRFYLNTLQPIVLSLDNSSYTGIGNCPILTTSQFVRPKFLAEFSTADYTLDTALNAYFSYLDSHLINITYDLTFNNVPHRNNGTIYKIERPSAPSSEPTGYVPVNYDYVINNFGDATYIYEGDTIINGVTGSAIQVELVSPSAVHVIVDNMDDFSNETNNQIINNYDFDFGDLNINGAIDDALPNISDGFNVVSGSAIHNLGGFLGLIPQPFLLVAFATFGGGIIIAIYNKVIGG